MSSETRLRILQSTASTCQVACLEFLLSLERGLFAEPVMRKFLIDAVLSGNECNDGDKAQSLNLLLNFRIPLSVKYLQWKEQKEGTLDYHSPLLNDTLLHIASINGQIDVIEHLLRSELFTQLFETNIFGHRAFEYALKDTVWKTIREGERANGFSLRAPDYLISWSELQHRAIKTVNMPEVSTLMHLLEGNHLIVDTAAESDFTGHMALGSTAAFLLRTALSAGMKPQKLNVDFPPLLLPFLCDIDLFHLSPSQRLAAVKHQLLSVDFGASLHIEVPLMPYWGYKKTSHTIRKQKNTLGTRLRKLSDGFLPMLRPEPTPSEGDDGQLYP